NAVRRLLHPRRSARDSEPAAEVGGRHSAQARRLAVLTARARGSVPAGAPAVALCRLQHCVGRIFVAGFALDLLVLLSRAVAIRPQSHGSIAGNRHASIAGRVAAGAADATASRAGPASGCQQNASNYYVESDWL